MGGVDGEHSRWLGAVEGALLLDEVPGHLRKGGWRVLTEKEADGEAKVLRQSRRDDAAKVLCWRVDAGLRQLRVDGGDAAHEGVDVVGSLPCDVAELLLEVVDVVLAAVEVALAELAKRGDTGAVATIRTDELERRAAQDVEQEGEDLAVDLRMERVEETHIILQRDRRRRRRRSSWRGHGSCVLVGVLVIIVVVLAARRVRRRRRGARATTAASTLTSTGATGATSRRCLATRARCRRDSRGGRRRGPITRRRAEGRSGVVLEGVDVDASASETSIDGEEEEVDVFVGPGEGLDALGGDVLQFHGCFKAHNLLTEEKGKRSKKRSKCKKGRFTESKSRK